MLASKGDKNTHKMHDIRGFRRALLQDGDDSDVVAFKLNPEPKPKATPEIGGNHNWNEFHEGNGRGPGKKGPGMEKPVGTPEGTKAYIASGVRGNKQVR